MIVVAGNPRSGTSLMMCCIVKALGEDSIAGHKFPQEANKEIAIAKMAKVAPLARAIRTYTRSKYPQNSDEAMAMVKDMNPNGFWECPFTVTGIAWRNNPDIQSLLQDIDDGTIKAIKLVNSGLYATDPSYVDKVIYMVRSPQNIAKSQERLRREAKFTLKDGRVVDLYEFGVINNPKFYLANTSKYAKWRVQNPDKEVLQIHYDDLVKTPAQTLSIIGEFASIANLSDSASLINTSLNRSVVDLPTEGDGWAEATTVHNKLLNGKFQDIVNILEDRKSYLSRTTAIYTCLRARAAVVYSNCVACRNNLDAEFITTGITRADVNGWDWRNEPCAFECGEDPFNESPKTIEESIADNHWLQFADV